MLSFFLSCSCPFSSPLPLPLSPTRLPLVHMFFAPFPLAFLLLFVIVVFSHTTQISPTSSSSSSSCFFFVHFLLLSNVFRHLKIHQSPQTQQRLGWENKRKKKRTKKRDTHTSPHPPPTTPPLLFHSTLATLSPFLPFPLSPPFRHLLSKLREKDGVRRRKKKKG